jgi:hypothetical protein
VILILTAYKRFQVHDYGDFQSWIIETVYRDGMFYIFVSVRVLLCSWSCKASAVTNVGAVFPVRVYVSNCSDADEVQFTDYLCLIRTSSVVLWLLTSWSRNTASDYSLSFMACERLGFYFAFEVATTVSTRHPWWCYPLWTIFKCADDGDEKWSLRLS